MIVIIDGYNFLKHFSPKKKDNLSSQRDYLIQQLNVYKKKHKTVTDILVVFDAGPFFHASREVCTRVVVIYSGQKNDADSWIISYVQLNRHRQIILVSNDNKLANECKKFGAESLSVDDFYDILDAVLLDARTDNFIDQSSTIHKYEYNDTFQGDENFKENKAFDSLIQQELIVDYQSKDEVSNQGMNKRKKGNAHRIKKKDKKRLEKIKKLL